MRIVQVVPGSGDNFYCENCVRDHSTLRALVDAGQDVVAVPMYLPPIADPLDIVAKAPVFYGGINSYLQQVSGLFRKTPRWVDRVFDAKWMLKLAAKRAGSVRARGLGDMTLSILKGRDGRQAKELERLLAWLQSQEKPDVVHLSTVLLQGIGLAIKKRLGVPLVVTLHDEDTWIDAMEGPVRDECWRTMAEGAKDVDAFIAVSRSFGDVMRDRLKIDPSKLHVVHIAVAPGEDPGERLPPDPPAIGYLARQSEGVGLGILAEAFFLLKQARAVPGLRLHVSGGATGDDAEFLERTRRRIAEAGVAGDVAFHDDFSPRARREFIRSLSVMCVPSPHGVAFGTYILEALAQRVPVVQPRVGAFPELVEATGGGVLYEPNDPVVLARTLAELLGDPARRAELGRRGRESVAASFNLETMAKRMIDVYRGVTSGRTS